jgi:hypothetical protein
MSAQNQRHKLTEKGQFCGIYPRNADMNKERLMFKLEDNTDMLSHLPVSTSRKNLV